MASIFVLSSNVFAHENRTFEAVLKVDYAKCKLIKENVFLTTRQKSQIESLLDDELHSQILLRYKSNCANTQGHVYIDSHIVRTLNETVVAHVETNSIRKYEIASFMEPKEYLAPQKWINQFLGKSYDDANKQFKVDALSGATLSASAIKKSAMKILVIDKVLSSND